MMLVRSCLSFRAFRIKVRAVRPRSYSAGNENEQATGNGCESLHSDGAVCTGRLIIQDRTCGSQQRRLEDLCEDSWLIFGSSLFGSALLPIILPIAGLAESESAPCDCAFS
jgi:hypothetical protein